MTNNLDGKTILIVGGTGRLGKVLVEEVIAHGGKALITSRNETNFTAFNQKSFNLKHPVRCFKLSLHSENEVKDFTDFLHSEKIAIDGLVHNAFASLKYKPVGKVPWSHWYDSIRVSVAASETIASALVQNREINGIKSIVNVSSIYAGRAPNFSMYLKNQNPNPVYYGPIKASVIALTRYLAAIWGEFDIRVNSVSPGGILSDQDQGFLESYNATVPQNRMVTPKEVTDAIIFLLSDQSKGITGTNITVDAGKTVW